MAAPPLHLPRTDAVVFDAYGTLFDVHALTAELDRAHPGHGAELSQQWRATQLRYTWLRALMGRYADFEQVTRESLVHTLRAAGLPVDDDVVAGVVERYRTLPPYPEVTRALPALRPRALWVYSNGNPAMVDPMLAASGVGALLDGWVSAADVPTYKPDPRGYALVPERTGVPAGRTLFVSSNAFDIAGAAAFGFVTAWLRRAGGTLEVLDDLAPDAVVATLDDLV